MCKQIFNSAIVHFSLVLTAIGFAIGSLISAIAANASFFGAGASSGLMYLAAFFLTLAIVSALNIINFDGIKSCVQNRECFPLYNDFYARFQNFRNSIYAAIAFILASAVAAGIPWFGAIFITIAYIMVLAALTLFLLAFAKLIQLRNCLNL